MLENWRQMDGNWLETIKHTYIAHVRFLPFLWFSMKLGVINSFLIVWFTMVQENIHIGKYLQNSYKNVT